MQNGIQLIQFDPVQMKSNLSIGCGEYIKFKPAPILRKYICCYWISPLINEKLINLTGVQRNETVVPDGCIDILFGNNKSGQCCRNIIVGTMSKYVSIDMQHEEIQTFGIRFYPGGINAFIKEKADLFTDKIELIDNIHEKSFMDLGERLSQITNIYKKIDYTNQYLISRLVDSIPYEDKFQSILFNIYKIKGKILVKDIAQYEVISEKQVSRIIKNRIGVGAKEFINIIRFQNVLKTMNSNKLERIIDIAIDAGYYDQSHFIHDFYNYSGMTPLEFIKKSTHL